MLRKAWNLILSIFRIAYFPRPMLTTKEWEIIADYISENSQEDIELILSGYCERLDKNEEKYNRIINKIDIYIEELSHPVSEERANQIKKDVKLIEMAFAK